MTDDRSGRIDALEYRYEERPKEHVSVCNLCGSTAHAEVARRDRYGYAAALRICTDCGLGFLSPRLTEEEYAQFYTSIYRPLVSAYHGRLINAETVQVDQRDYAAELSSFLAPLLVRAPRSIMDVGGSTGVVGDVLREAFGSKLTVLDPAEDELAVATAAGAETIQGFAERFDPGRRTWELVLLCQTIDHLLDIAGTLDSIRAMTASDGHAFVDVLDLEFAYRRNGGVEGAAKIDHPYYLTRATARAFFAMSGFDVAAERLSDDGHWGFLLRPGEPRELVRIALRENADRLLERIWTKRADV